MAITMKTLQELLYPAGLPEKGLCRILYRNRNVPPDQERQNVCSGLVRSICTVNSGLLLFRQVGVNHLDNHHCAEVEVANAMAYLAPFFHVLWMLCHNSVRNVHVLWIPFLHAKLQPRCCIAVDPTSHNLPPHNSPHAWGPCLLARLVVRVSGRPY